MNNLAIAGEINPHLCRFALIRGFEGRRPLFSSYAERLVADFPGPIEALRSWTDTLGEAVPPHLTLAVAGPVGEDRIHIPQSGWSFSLSEFRSSMGFDRVEVLNTSAAAGRGLEQLVGADCIPLGGMARPATPLAHGRYAIVRPDYGLGVAALIVDGRGSSVINTEAGHLAFAPGTPFEVEVLKALSSVYGRVSWERLISWPALTALHQAVAAIEGVPATPLSPLEVLLYGRTGADPACARTLDCFFGVLGDFCGQVVLSLCSNQGVFLLGRTIQEAHDLVGISAFRARFETQGRLSATVRELPTWAATSSTTLLTGAALNFLDRTGRADVPAPAPGPVRKPAPPAPVSRRVVDAADVGLLALDADLTIAAANPRFWDGLGLRSADIAPGAPAAVPLAALVEAGVWSAEAAAAFTEALRAGQPATAEWRAAGGRVLRQVAAPLDGGGWVITSHDVTIDARRSAELEAIASSLRQARIEADAANQAKSTFLAIMSHEIRTPLNGVLGMAQAMDAEPLPPVQRERLDVIRESGESLLAILNDVLDLSKIEAGKLVLEEVAFDLEDLLKGAHATFTALANKRGVSFACTTAPAARGGWRGDPTRVRQILYNLISNALKFTEAGGVRVHADEADGRLRLSVSDDGVGIPADKLGQLFDRFTQADETTTRKFGGTGLGLAVCADLAKLMHGSIDVASTEGEGSTFTVALPLARAARPAASAAAAPGPAPAPPGLSRLRVLAAEDNSVNQLVLKTLLHQIGVDLLVVDDGAEALAAWRGGGWDVILMDVQMPNMDGPAAARAIRAAEAAEGRPRTPIIALTANVMSHQIQDYLAAGMDGFVAKPLQVGALFEALRAAAADLDADPARHAATA